MLQSLTDAVVSTDDASAKGALQLDVDVAVTQTVRARTSHTIVSLTAPLCHTGAVALPDASKRGVARTVVVGGAAPATEGPHVRGEGAARKVGGVCAGQVHRRARLAQAAHIGFRDSALLMSARRRARRPSLSVSKAHSLAITGVTVR